MCRFFQTIEIRYYFTPVSYTFYYCILISISVWNKNNIVVVGFSFNANFCTQKAWHKRIASYGFASLQLSPALEAHAATTIIYYYNRLVVKINRVPNIILFSSENRFIRCTNNFPYKIIWHDGIKVHFYFNYWFDVQKSCDKVSKNYKTK